MYQFYQDHFTFIIYIYINYYNKLIFMINKIFH